MRVDSQYKPFLIDRRICISTLNIRIDTKYKIFTLDRLLPSKNKQWATCICLAKSRVKSNTQSFASPASFLARQNERNIHCLLYENIYTCYNSTTLSSSPPLQALTIDTGTRGTLLPAIRCRRRTAKSRMNLEILIVFNQRSQFFHTFKPETNKNLRISTFICANEKVFKYISLLTKPLKLIELSLIHI